MSQKIAKHHANDASNDVHRPPLTQEPAEKQRRAKVVEIGHSGSGPSDILCQA